MRRLLGAGFVAVGLGYGSQGSFQEGGSSSSSAGKQRRESKGEGHGPHQRDSRAGGRGGESSGTARDVLDRRKASGESDAEGAKNQPEGSGGSVSVGTDAQDKRILKDSIGYGSSPPVAEQLFPKDPGKGSAGNRSHSTAKGQLHLRASKPARNLLPAHAAESNPALPARSREHPEPAHVPPSPARGEPPEAHSDGRLLAEQDASAPTLVQEVEIPEELYSYSAEGGLNSNPPAAPAESEDYRLEQDRLAAQVKPTKKFVQVEKPAFHVSGDLDSLAWGQGDGVARLLADRARERSDVTVQGVDVETYLGIDRYRDLDLRQTSEAVPGSDEQKPLGADGGGERPGQIALETPALPERIAQQTGKKEREMLPDGEVRDGGVDPEIPLRAYHPTFHRMLQQRYQDSREDLRDDAADKNELEKRTPTSTKGTTTSGSSAATKSRRLAAQPSGGTWEWLVGAGTSPTTTTVSGPSVPGVAKQKDVAIVGYASTNLWLQNAITVDIRQPNTFGAGAHPDPRFKFVDGDIIAREQCQDFQGRDVRMGTIDFAGTLSYGISGRYANHTQLIDAYIDTTNQALLKSENQPFAFMHGGSYKICYAPDGDFVSTAPRTTAMTTSFWLPSPMLVYGVRSPCTYSPTCIKDEEWHCWYPGLADSPAECAFAFTGAKFREGFSLFASSVSKMSWTGLYTNEEYDVNGTVNQTATPSECRLTDPVSNIWQPFPSTFITVTGATIANMPKVAHDQTGAFTMRLCYCGDYSQGGAKCDGKEEFIQAFGKLYIWRVSICDYGNALASECQTAPYQRVLPHQRFVIHVSCPMGGACHATDTNRIGILEGNLENDRSFWDPTAGCLQAGVDSKSVYWPSAYNSQAVTAGGGGRVVGGGDRQDYKLWREWQPRIDFPIGGSGKMDICFCQSDCHQQSNMNWYKIGHVFKANPVFASAEGADGTAAGAKHLIRYTGKPGAFVFFGGLKTPFYVPATVHANNKNDYPAWGDAPRYSGDAVLKITAWDYGSVPGITPAVTMEAYAASIQGFDRDDMCNTRVPDTLDTTLIDVIPKVTETDKMAVTAFHSFTNGGTQRSTMKKPGIVAICYCGIVDSTGSACDVAKGVKWRFFGLLMISGPLPGQSWSLPTDAVSRIILQGSGFDEGDVLRIVPNNVQCTDNSNNPAPDGSHKVGCPSVEGAGCITTNGCPANSGITCRTASATDGVYGSFIYLQTLGKQQIQPPVGLKAIDTRYSTDTFTVLEFTGNIQFSGIQEGDTLLIDKNDLLITDRSASTYDITQWKLDSRIREFANHFTNNWQPPDVHDPTISDKRTNPLGWKVSFPTDPRISAADRPKFLQIPLPYKHSIGPVVVNGQIVYYRYPYTVTFKGNAGRWLRSSATQSNTEIKGKSATATSAPLRVCWGRLEGSAPKFYADAGTLTFFDPAAMPKAHVSLTSTQQTGYSPVIVSFELSTSQTLYKQYSIGRQHQLTLRFKDLEKIDPRRNTDHSPVVVPQEMGSGEVLELDAFQNVCGSLFVELWSNDREGFPMPKGCYYSRKYRDASEGTTGNPQWREITLVFPFSNGFKNTCMSKANAQVACQYQLVLNAHIGAQSAISAGDNLIDVYTKCSRCGPNGSDIFFERGRTVLNADSPLGGSQLPGDQNSPLLAQFVIPNPAVHATSSDEAFDLTVNTVVDAQLVGGDALQAIGARNHLRLYLFPLLAWEVPTSVCSVLCVDYQVGGTNYKCGLSTQVNPTLDVTIQSLTPFSRRNFLKVRMPDAMTDVLTSSIKHGIQISSLEFPATGFFNLRMGVQLTDALDAKPVYITSTGLLHKREAAGGETTGRIVVNGATGYGPQPFHSQIRNELYVRLALGTTMFHNGQVDAAYLEIHTPRGNNKQYTGRCEQTVAVPSNIPNFFDFDMDGYIDYNHGTLGVGASEGKWGFGAQMNICKYTMKPGQATIYAGMSVYLKMTVDNPVEAMTKHDFENVWKIKLFSKGVTSQQAAPRAMAGADGSGMRFNPAPGTVLEAEATYKRPGEPKLWYQNVGVVSPLEKPVLSPTHFRLSTELRPEYSEMYIFFKIVTNVGRNGFIKVDAPCGFDFGNQVLGKPNACVNGGLPRYYYDYIDVNYDQTRNLTSVLSCTAVNLIPQCPAPGPYNRAVLNIGDSMGLNPDTGRLDQYGFFLRVKHSLEFRNPQDFSMWQLFVADHADFVVDGTRDTLFFQKDSKEGTVVAAADKAFGLYATDFTKIPSIAVSVEDLTPASLKPQGAKDTYVTFDGFRMLADIHGVAFRFTSPHGFRWVTDPGVVFESRPRGSTGYLGWPCSGPLEVHMFTQARFTLCNFNGMTTYGFTMAATVPDLSPTYSANSFYVELGFIGTQVTNSSQNNTYRYNAMPLTAPLVRALRNTLFDYRTGRAGSENVVTIEFRLITPLTKVDEALVIEGKGKNAEFQFKCDTRVYDSTGVTYSITEQNIFPFLQGTDYNDLPAEYGCKDDRQGFLYLYVNTTRLEELNHFPAGYYKMDVKLTNLATKNEANDQWNFGTYKNGLPQETQGGPLITPETIDAQAVAPGFPILDEMTKGILVKFADAELEADVRQGTGRDDRPGYMPDAPQVNQLIFRFQMKNAPNVKIEGGFVLKGPSGFSFANNCKDKIVVDKNKVFGEHSGHSASVGLVCEKDYLTNCGAMNPCVASMLNPRCRKMKMSAAEIYSAYAIAEWPVGKEPEMCNGFENLAKITIPVGLDDGQDYVFRIEIESNPPSTPDPNFWSIEYSGEASTLFESFALQTVSGLTMSQVSKAVRSANLAESFKNPVEFTFRPMQTVPRRLESDASGGAFTVEAPTGYDFVFDIASRRLLRDDKTRISDHELERLDSTLRKLRQRKTLLEGLRRRLQASSVDGRLPHGCCSESSVAGELAEWEAREIKGKGRAPSYALYPNDRETIARSARQEALLEESGPGVYEPVRLLPVGFGTQREKLEGVVSAGADSREESSRAVVVHNAGTAGSSEKRLRRLSIPGPGEHFTTEDQELLEEELRREMAHLKTTHFKNHDRWKRSGLATQKQIFHAERAHEHFAPLRRLVTRKCNLSLNTVDRTTIMVPGIDIDCEILGSGKLQARILSLEKEISNTKQWQLIVYVYNRANIVTPETGTGNFELRTFDRSMTLLDLARIPGFDVINIINLWQVHNVNSVFNGMEKVPAVYFICSLPDEVLPDDDLEIHAPLGFDLRVEGTAGQCNNFKWGPGYNPLEELQNIAPLCTCDASYALNGITRCGMRFSMTTTNTPVLPMNHQLRWSVDTKNPAQVTSEIGNHWVVFHKRATGSTTVGGVTRLSYTVRSTHAYKSWEVRPQLQNVAITIVGTRKAAESYTDISFSFVPVQNAVTMLAEVVSPPGFKFGTATVGRPHVIDLATSGNILVVNSMNVQANVPKLNLVIKNVKLGMLGGQTVWNIKTYINELVNGAPQVPQDIRDERLSVEGFIMPGRLQVLSNPAKRLESDYFVNPSVYPTEAQFPAREAELNTAEISFTTSQTVYSGGYIYITCTGLQPYVLDKEAFSLSGGTTVVDQNNQVVVLNPATGGLEVQLQPSKPASEPVIQANQIYKIRFRVTPKIGSSNWRIETFALNNFALPSNTNDNEEGPFAPVYRIGLEITVLNDRRPPGAQITLLVKVMPGNASVRQVVIIAPPTFDFPQDCGLNCEAYITYQPESRKSVRIASPDGMALTVTTLSAIRIHTITPAVTPDAVSWFVQTMAGSLSGGFTVTGWERYQGFPIRQMEPAYLWYPQRRGLAGANFAFTFNFAADNGRVIKVIPPVLYEVYCSTMPASGAPAFFQVSLPGGKPGCEDNPLQLTLTVNMRAGRYSFIIGGDVPAQDAQAGVTQEFALIVESAFGDVLDATYRIPARNPLMPTRASGATLNWGGVPRPGRRQLVHVGLDYDEDMTGIEAVLVTLPLGVTPDFSKELLARKRDVKNLNKNFPVATADQWADFSGEGEVPAFVKIITEERSGLTIEKARYKWEFYVQLPIELPPENIWYVSLCQARQCKNINVEPASAIPVTFPIQGFQFYNASDKVLYPSSARGRYGDGTGAGGGSVVWISALLSVVLPLLLMVVGAGEA